MIRSALVSEVRYLRNLALRGHPVAFVPSGRNPPVRLAVEPRTPV
jgi:hypothetical protein